MFVSIIVYRSTDRPTDRPCKRRAQLMKDAIAPSTGRRQPRTVDRIVINTVAIRTDWNPRAADPVQFGSVGHTRAPRGREQRGVVDADFVSLHPPRRCRGRGQKSDDKVKSYF